MSIKTRTSGIMVDINVEPAATTGWQGVTSGLTHHWPMDDDNGGNNPIDIIAGLNGTASGAGVTSAVGPSGAAGTARQFDGVDIISFASNVFSDLTGDSTGCIWIFSPDVTVNGPDGNDQDWFNFGDGTRGTCSQILTSGSSPVNFSLGNVIGTEPGQDSLGTPLANNTWLHLAWTFPSGGTIPDTILYVNGVANNTGGGGTSASASQTTNVFGGRASNSHRLVNGARVGRVLTYTRVLSAAEILQNFNAQ